MKGKFAIVLAFIGVFNLGTYASSQFKFHTPIEWYKWTVTSIFTLGAMAYARSKVNEGPSIKWDVFINKKPKQT